MYMKRENKKTIFIIAFMIIGIGMFSFGSKTAYSRMKTYVPADVSAKEELPLVIEDFENATTGDKGWAVESEPKPFVGKEPEERLKMKNPVPRLEIKIIPGAPADMEKETWSLNGMGRKKDKILGVSFRFRYPGTNAVSVLPPPEVNWKDRTPVFTFNPATGKVEQERGLELPGRAKEISLWVMGQGAPYTLEVWVKDYRGGTRILKFGSVDFVGWRPVKVSIPADMPQETPSYPEAKPAKITRFVLRPMEDAPKDELYETAYFFFDQIKVLTNLYKPNFDGANLDKIFNSTSKGVKAGTK
jgi:hypothetical protein